MVDMGLPNSDRSSTHLLFDLAAQTLAGCTCNVLITVSASSSRCWYLNGSLDVLITEGIDNKVFSQRGLFAHALLFRVFYFRSPGGPQKYFNDENFPLYSHTS